MKDWSCASRRGSKHPPKWTQVTAKKMPTTKIKKLSVSADGESKRMMDAS